MKKTFIPLLTSAALLLMSHGAIKAQAISEGFDDISTLSGNGWSFNNLSSPAGTSWAQGPSNGVPFSAYNGAANSYISADYHSVSGTSGTISNWMLSPNRTLRNGDVITFYTRKIFPDAQADRLEVRLSTNGSSVNVGTTATSLGDFSTLLLSINPTLTTGVYPTTWTMYTITISGLSAPTSGRIAFRYYVTSGGSAGVNSEYIGIDDFQYTPYSCPTLSISPSPGALSGGAAGVAYSNSFSQTGALGTPNYAITAGALPPGLTLSASGNISGTPTATGTFNFTVMMSDNSGCSTTSAYNITVVCPSNPTSLSIPALCSNSGVVTLTGGSPAGGTYSGTGVVGNTFDPTAGTQTVTYDYTDPYGCAFSSNALAIVNTAPVVGLSALSPVCAESSTIALSNGSPAGGVYSGTYVSGAVFTPATPGTSDIIYSYTDANGCSASDTISMLVNDLPMVGIDEISGVCVGSPAFALTLGTPAGGVYGGTNVSAGVFNPLVSGVSDISYSYTDANGCTVSDTVSVMVYDLPAVSIATLAPVCEESALVNLNVGSPAGGVYSGSYVLAGNFNPVVAGTSDIVYSYTDANGCTASDTTSITVNICTGIQEQSAITGFRYFPNPVSGILTVEFEQSEQANVSLQIVDLQGKVIASDALTAYAGSYSHTFDLSTYPKGMYVMTLSSGNASTHHKLVIQ